MGKKYIVELGRCERLYKAYIGNGKPNLTWLSPEVDLTPYTEPDTGAIREEAFRSGYDAACKIIDVESKTNAAYQKGLSDAWECARKIASDNAGQNYSIFGQHFTVEILNTHSASEVIEEIRAYEQAQKEKEEQIQVGDEVELKCGVSPAIYMRGTNGSDEIYLLFNDGSCGMHSRSEIERKTGRHFHEIAEVLRKMKETDNG